LELIIRLALMKLGVKPEMEEVSGELVAGGEEKLRVSSEVWCAADP
jgi:hypothetical protein